MYRRLYSRDPLSLNRAISLVEIYVIQTGEIKSPRFNIRIWSSVVVEAAGKKRAVFFLLLLQLHFLLAGFLSAAAATSFFACRFSSCCCCNFVFCVKTHLFILGPLEKGGSIAPQSFTDQSFLSQLENRYFFSSPWILDIPTALIQVTI